MSAVVLFVELEIEPGQRDNYVARARQHRDNVMKNEPNCHRFDISVPDDNDTVVRLYEVYADQAAFEHHMQTPYMQEYREDTGPWIKERKLSRCTLANG